MEAIKAQVWEHLYKLTVKWKKFKNDSDHDGKVSNFIWCDEFESLL